MFGFTMRFCQVCCETKHGQNRVCLSVPSCVESFSHEIACVNTNKNVHFDKC